MVKRWNLAHNLDRKGLIVPQLRRQVCFSSCDPVENALQWSVTDRNGDHASNIRQQVGFTWNPDPTGVYISCEVLEIGFEPDKPNEVLSEAGVARAFRKFGSATKLADML
jgi:hypothetical protein